MRTTWPKHVAMPHGWAVAELVLLLRDCIALEDGDRLVLLAGVARQWLTDPRGMCVEGMPTHFGELSFTYVAADGRARLDLGGAARPPGGTVLRLPTSLRPAVEVDGRTIVPRSAADFLLPPGTRGVAIRYGAGE